MDALPVCLVCLSIQCVCMSTCSVCVYVLFPCVCLSVCLSICVSLSLSVCVDLPFTHLLQQSPPPSQSPPHIRPAYTHRITDLNDSSNQNLNLGCGQSEAVIRCCAPVMDSVDVML